MSFVNWVIDTLVNEDVIDLYFILSDMFEINLTDEEVTETALNDAMCNDVHRRRGDDDPRPMGKRVY